MERSIDIATGESVAFSYELAGLGSRFLAVFIDILIQATILVAAITIFGLIGSSLPSAAPKAAPAMRIVPSLVIAAIVFAVFMLFFGYFIAFETLWDGRTPGKRIIGIRVVRDGGFPVDFTSALIRNVVRTIEFSLGFYAISAISTLLSPQNRRLGDFAAGTLVIRDRFAERAPDLPTSRAPSETDDPLVRGLGVQERDIVRRYAERRASLSGSARDALAAQIAAIVRPNLPARFDHLDDDELLLHVAGALH